MSGAAPGINSFKQVADRSERIADRWQRVANRFERVSDRCNAILVKEVRQSLKSRQFAVTFLLLLLAAWTGSLFGIAYHGEGIEYGSPAETFFGGFFFVLCAASLVIVPFAAFRSIVEERSENTLELLQITALSPRQIVRGKTQSALVQVLVYFAAIAPFIAFTALLPGFDVVRIAFSLAMLLVASFCFSMIALAIGVQARQKLSQAFSSLAVVGMSAGGMLAFYSMMLAVAGEIRFDTKEAWWGLSLALFVSLSTAYLCQQVAVAHLTFESDNRSSGVRLTILAQWLVCWLGLVAFLIIVRPPHLDENGWFVMLTSTTIFITLAGIYFATEGDLLSRRVRRGLPRSGLLRLAWIPFLPGGARGLLYGLASLTMLGLVAGLILKFEVTPSGGRWDFILWYAYGLACYSVIYIGAGAILARFLRRVMRTVVAGHLLALMTAITIILNVVYYLSRYFLGIYTTNLLLIDLLNPAYTLEAIADKRSAGATAPLAALGVAALLVLAVNLRAMRRAITEVLQSPVRAPSEPREAEPQTTLTADP